MCMVGEGISHINLIIPCAGTGQSVPIGCSSSPNDLKERETELLQRYVQKIRCICMNVCMYTSVIVNGSHEVFY